MRQSFTKQVSRLKEAGYPEWVITRACGKVAKKVKAGQQESEDNHTTTRKNFAVIPYVHKLSHGIGSVGGGCQVDVVFSVGRGLRQVCPAVRGRLDG
uniref:Tick transposon n=1 Tax=Rhipicephalus appendiculatus TaxID=34631 RepID=A0A131YZ92_RHIAP